MWFLKKKKKKKDRISKPEDSSLGDRAALFGDWILAFLWASHEMDLPVHNNYSNTKR
jgi:hypothetical protein